MRECFAFTGSFRDGVDVTHVLAAISHLLGGCGLESFEDLERQRHENLTKWHAAAIADYEIVYERLCFCDPPFEVRILVRSGEIVHVINPRNGHEIDNPYAGSSFAFNSIEGVFKVIADAIAYRPIVLLVDYHPELGYPTRVEIDDHAEIADDEITIEISALRPPPDGF